MAIRNYTSEVAASRSATECIERLGAAGARLVTIAYEGSEPTAITFTLTTEQGDIDYRLAVNIEGMKAALTRDQRTGNTHVRPTSAQASRTAWRCLRDWLAAQLAFREAGMGTLDQLLLPFALHESGGTLYEVITKRGIPALPVGRR